MLAEFVELYVNLNRSDMVEVIADGLKPDADQNFEQLILCISGGKKQVDRLSRRETAQ